MNASTLAADEMRLLAVVKSIEVIGEASTKVSEGMRAAVPSLDWTGMKRMRNRMIHAYDTINPQRASADVGLEVVKLVVTPAIRPELSASGTELRMRESILTAR